MCYLGVCVQVIKGMLSAARSAAKKIDLEQVLERSNTWLKEVLERSNTC